MRKRTRDTDEPVGELKVVADFLPPPHRLVLREEGVKVTMVLSRSSVEYFKRAAKKYHTPYQKMIRNVIDAYTARFPNP